MDQTTFETQLAWVMEHIQELEVQDFVDFICNNRQEFYTLTRASKKPSLEGWTEANAQVMASPFGQKIVAWCNSLPEEIHRPADPISPDPLPELPPAPHTSPKTPIAALKSQEDEVGDPRDESPGPPKAIPAAGPTDSTAACSNRPEADSSRLQRRRISAV